MAHAIAGIDQAGLHAFVVAILRPLQAQHIIAAAERAAHAAPQSIEASCFFMGSAASSIFSFGELASREPRDFEVDLARDMVLPTMWHRTCVASAFGSIGSSLKCGVWRQDPNHRVALWLPWRIAFVNNGNHSIAAGIVRAEGVLTPTSVYDLTDQLRQFQCDGRTYFRALDGHSVAPVQDQRIAAVWEIGRLMLDISGTS